MSIALCIWNKKEKCFYMASDSCAGKGTERRPGYTQKTFCLKNNILFSATGKPVFLLPEDYTDEPDIYSMEQLVYAPVRRLVEGISGVCEIAEKIYIEYMDTQDELKMMVVGFENGLPRLFIIDKNSNGYKSKEERELYACFGTPSGEQASQSMRLNVNDLQQKPIETITRFFDEIIAIQSDDEISVSRPYNIFKIEKERGYLFRRIE